MDGAMLYVYYMNYGSSLNVENSQVERENKIVKSKIEQKNFKRDQKKVDLNITNMSYITDIKSI